jgi:hypothetical protein
VNRVRVIAGAALASFVVLLGGCGEDGHRPTASIRSVPTVVRGVSATPGGPSARNRARAPARPKRQTQVGGTSARERAIAGVLARLPQSKRVGIVATVARMTFSRFGFTSPQLTVAPSGYGLRASLSAREACTATESTEHNLVSVLRQGIFWLSAVQVAVGPTPLSRYVRSHCRPVGPPEGSGPVVLTESGTSPATTGSFTVTGRRWAIEYFNGGSHLQVLVMKRGLPSGDPVLAAGRGPGRHMVTGAGKFTLQIAGSGEWIVRVRDGG